jgi:hypothetical protein
MDHKSRHTMLSIIQISLTHYKSISIWFIQNTPPESKKKNCFHLSLIVAEIMSPLSTLLSSVYDCGP